MLAVFPRKCEEKGSDRVVRRCMAGELWWLVMGEGFEVVSRDEHYMTHGHDVQKVDSRG